MLYVWKSLEECHFVLESTEYSKFRCKYIHKNYWKRPSMSKFTELMTTDNKPILQKLPCFVQKYFALRNELLFSQAQALIVPSAHIEIRVFRYSAVC